MTRKEEEGMLVKLGPVCEEDVEGVDVIVVMLNEKEGASVEEFECSNGGVAAMVVLQHIERKRRRIIMWPGQRKGKWCRSFANLGSEFNVSLLRKEGMFVIGR